jgi:hypothetical protein
MLNVNRLMTALAERIRSGETVRLNCRMHDRLCKQLKGYITYAWVDPWGPPEDACCDPREQIAAAL